MNYTKLIRSNSGGALCNGLILALIISATSLHSSNANAGFYKCIDTDGNVTYSQTQCPVDETVDKVISSGGSSSSNNDCSIARHFMSKTAKQMRRGQSSGEVYDQYGGMDSIPRTSVALINYVYTFQYNHTVTAERITSLSVARCSSGSFGSTRCEDFPTSYIDQLGGCERAVLGPQYGQQTEQANRAAEQEAGYGRSRAVQRSSSGLNFGNQTGVNAAQALQQARIKCVSKNTAELRSVANQMRERISAGEQDNLRARKRTLQKRLSDC